MIKDIWWILLLLILLLGSVIFAVDHGCRQNIYHHCLELDHFTLDQCRELTK